MSPNPLLPKGQPPWTTSRVRRSRESAVVGKGLSEEQLADYHAGRLHRLTFGQTFASVLVLTVAAFVVILPFIYMVLISLKSTAEIGNGRILPNEFQKYVSGKTAWLQFTVPAEKAVSVGDTPDVPVWPSKDIFRPWSMPGDLPLEVIMAQRLSITRPGEGSRLMTVLLEVPDPNRDFVNATSAYVFLPWSQQTWMPVEGTVLHRSWVDVAGQLLQNYKLLFHWDQLVDGRLGDWLKSGYPRWYFNSLFVATITVLLGVFFDSLAAFAFAKFQFPFKRTLFAILIASLMIPYPVTLVPSFFIFAKLGFYNTYLALIIPGIVSAFGIFLVRQYMETIPDDMLDAARVDGAGDFQVYWRVMLPAARPVLAALAVFRFLFQWNTYLYPLVLTNKDSMKTVQLGIATMEDMHGRVDYGLQMAGSTVAILPILFVYLMMQRHFISGITMGGSKG